MRLQCAATRCCLQVCDGDMLLLPLQSGCEARIQKGRAYTCVLAVSVGISHTNTSLQYRRAVLPSVVRPSEPFLAFQPFLLFFTVTISFTLLFVLLVCILITSTAQCTCSQHLHSCIINSPPSSVVMVALTVLPLASVAWADTPFSPLTITTYCTNGLRPVI